MIARTDQPFAIDIGDLVARLAARAPELASDLLPGGVRRGSEWCVAAADSPFGCSTSVNLRKGLWSAWAADIGGDALNLVTSAKFGGDVGAAIRWSIDWLRIDRRDRERAAVGPRAKVPDEQDNRAKRAAAFRWWLIGRPLTPSTEAFDYLDRTRGIDLAAFGRVPRVLRAIDSLPNTEARRGFPALIAGVFDRHGKFLTIHRTWLERQSDGRVLKAPVAEPKKAYGPFKGGLIPLWRGASDRPWKDPAPDDVLGLTEGIENGLTYAAEVPEHRVAAAITVGNLGHLSLHPALRDIIIAADNDQPGSQAARTLERAVARFLAEGRCVRLARAPDGTKDLNDLHLQQAG